MRPLHFKHPLENDLLASFCGESAPSNSIFTGTAGDGKSHLCGRVWHALGGGADQWAADDVYFQLHSTVAGRPVPVHVIRDLTALLDEDPRTRDASKGALLDRLSTLLFEPDA